MSPSMAGNVGSLARTFFGGLFNPGGQDGASKPLAKGDEQGELLLLRKLVIVRRDLLRGIRERLNCGVFPTEEEIATLLTFANAALERQEGCVCPQCGHSFYWRHAVYPNGGEHVH